MHVMICIEKIYSSAESQDGRTRRWVEATCKCGNRFKLLLDSIKSGNTKSCGCYKRAYSKIQWVTHGGTCRQELLTTYNSWKAMKSRCYIPSNVKFHNYGGRGITVCKRWMKFSNFLEDMGIRPYKYTLDRIDCNGNYCKKNCRWATTAQQNINKRTNRVLEKDGIRLPVCVWAKKLGINCKTIDARLRKGWSDTESLRIELGTKR